MRRPDDGARLTDAAAFARSGHVLIRDLVTSSEVARLRELLPDRAVKSVADRGIERFVRLSWHSAAIREFVLDRRFGTIAASLLGVGAVRVYQDAFLRKRPGTPATPWHNDATYWPHDGPGLTMWLPLVDLPADSGLLSFVPLESTRDVVGRYELAAESEEVVADLIEREGWTVRTHGPMRAGDATFHHGMTLHRADANASTIDRDVFTVIYYADGARIVDHPSAEQRPDLALFPGCAAGSLAASPQHPLAGAPAPGGVGR